MPTWVKQNKILVSILAVVVAAVIAMYALDGDGRNTFPGNNEPSPSPSASATPKPDPTPTQGPKGTKSPQPEPSNPGPSSNPEPSSHPTRNPGGPTHQPSGGGNHGPTSHPGPTTSPPSPQQVVNQVCQLAADGVGFLNIALLTGLKVGDVQKILHRECPQLLALVVLHLFK